MPPAVELSIESQGFWEKLIIAFAISNSILFHLEGRFLENEKDCSFVRNKNECSENDPGV